MTTIATDGKTMAGDSLTTGGNHRVAFHPKVKRAADGSLFGCSGLSWCGERFARWMTEGGEKPELHDEFSALVLKPDGTVEYYCQKLEPVSYVVPMAIGSGDDLAIGAMLAGKTPAEAVAIAIERDKNSGGTITVLELHPKAKLEAA